MTLLTKMPEGASAAILRPRAIALALVLVAATTAVASAQTTTTLTRPARTPIRSMQNALTGELTFHGAITSVNGKYGLTVRDDQGGTETVALHQGTVINPTGLQLMPGMQVTFTGHPDSGTFDVNQMDAPVRYLAAQERTRRAEADVTPLTPPSIPDGTFQTTGPSAEGGG